MSPSTEVVDDAELLSRAQAGDRLAFADLYDRHVRPVYWQAYSMVHDAGEAEEITQDVFVTAWRRIRAITPVDESLLPWLLVTARYTALNAYRRASRRRSMALDDAPASAESTVEREVESAQIRAEIDKAVAALAPNDRRLYELCVEGDRTYEQAARELGVTHAVVRNRLHRLRARLRADLRSMRETS